MILIWKNKGILIPVYVVTTFVSIATLSGVLKRNIGGIFANDYNIQITLGLTFLSSGLWTYLTSEEFVKKDGQKIKVDFENKFFFIQMKVWGYIFLAAGLVFLINGLIVTIE
jgi:hypothetical protein